MPHTIGTIVGKSRENELATITLTQKRGAIHSPIEVLFVDGHLGARHLNRPHGLPGESVEFGKPAATGIALSVDLASHIHIRMSVEHLAHDRGIDVVVVVVIPHRLHGVEIQAKHIAVIIAHIAIIFVHTHTRFHARRHTGALASVAQHAVHLTLIGTHIVFINQPVFAWPKHKSIGKNGRRVRARPMSECLWIVARRLHHQRAGHQIHRILTHISLGTQSMARIEQTVHSRVDHRRTLQWIAQIEGLTRCLAGVKVDKAQLPTERSHHNFL